MTSHNLKTDPEVFEAVRVGKKTFEIRLNDRDFQVGDELCLRETVSTGAEMRDGAPLVYTGRLQCRTVSHVLTGYGLMDGWCCLSFDASAALADARRKGAMEAQQRMFPCCGGNDESPADHAMDCAARALPLPTGSQP